MAPRTLHRTIAFLLATLVLSVTTNTFIIGLFDRKDKNDVVVSSARHDAGASVPSGQQQDDPTPNNSESLTHSLGAIADEALGTMDHGLLRNIFTSTVKTTKRRGDSMDGAAIDGTFPNSTVPPDQSNHSSSSCFSSNQSISFGGCCGVGHRLTRNLRVLVSAAQNHQHAYAAWTDVAWGDLFHDTSLVSQAPLKQGDDGGSGYQECSEHYTNDYPRHWAGPGVPDPPAVRIGRGWSTDIYGQFGPMDQQLFHHPLAQKIATSLRDSVSHSVRSQLDQLRRQYRPLHLCAHFRLGNREMGDWAMKPWRHVANPRDLFKLTLFQMMTWVHNATLASSASANGTVSSPSNVQVSVFVASDTSAARDWFRRNMPYQWAILDLTHGESNDTTTNNSGNNPRATTSVGLPPQGVWFGDIASTTADTLSAANKTRAMIEAVAEMFALGDCSVLLVPTYSSFVVIPIMLSFSRRVPVLFRHRMTYVQQHQTMT